LKNFRIGVGAGFAGDRFDGAELLAQQGNLDALVFECLAERTIGLASLRKHSGSGPGFDPLLMRRLEGTLPAMLAREGRVLTNAGAADPRAAADLVKSKYAGAKVAAVLGDDVLEQLNLGSQILGTDRQLSDFAGKIVSANAYLGADAMVQALQAGADVVITGRCGDAALFLAPLIAHFDWTATQQIAAGILVGHLLECSTQVSGGYFADKGKAAVPDIANLGFPFADVAPDGSFVITKIDGTGGLISRETVLEQLLYEITDPHRYITPDLTIDISSVALEQIALNKVSVSGASAIESPSTYKVSVGIDDGFGAKGEISYGGESALYRAQLAAEIIRERWSENHKRGEELTIEYLGYNATRPWKSASSTPDEVCLRIGAHTFDESAAKTLCQEIEALYLNGPAGGGGATARYSKSVGIVSTLIDKSEVHPEVVFVA